ncbi:MAG: rhomboid family intramembrane serine protease [Gammaproteobacteria bacterium]|nr:rhomboid family intramembrane serine protease [Gammaproteobacteria bacterium]
MVIIPFDKKIEWNNPPAITLLLIFINTMVFFSFQTNDNDKFNQVEQYYYQSGLADIELPYFQKQLIKQGKLTSADSLPSFFELEFDRPFMQALENGEFITRSNPVYTEWKSKRTQLNAMKNNIVSWHYALKTGEPTLLTFFTHMFLHADFSHLFGNMIFLLAVGFIVELSMSSSLFITAYLLCGILSNSITLYTGSDSLIPSLGASGAIAGLMGMYAVLFGLRKVRFFYFIYVYFDYIKLPAFYLLILWLGKELYQQIAYSNISNVNYLAHIGGLISGASIIYGIRKFYPQAINHHYLDERELTDSFISLLNKANGLVNTLDYEKAAPLFAKLLSEHPDNREVLYGYYKTHKLNTGSNEHHHGAISILSLTDRDAATNTLILDVFNEYSQLRSPRFSVVLLNNLIRRFTTINAFEQAEKLVSIMQKQPEKFLQLPDFIGSLINKLISAGDVNKAEVYNAYLSKHYPNHQFTLLAKNKLK